MANDITSNPWILDTAAVITTNATRIKSMVYKPAAAANDLTVLNNAGKTVWDIDALAASPTGDEVFPVNDFITNGFNLSVIDGGSLWVYVK